MTAANTNSSAIQHRWLVLWLLGTGQLMLILDVTVVAVALPHMETDLGVSREVLTWVVSGYSLTFGSLLLLGGKAVDHFGPKPVVLAGLGVFTSASLVAGLAETGPVLLSGRVAQGVGAAMLSPAALSSVVRVFDGDERNRALGIWSALGGGGAALGVLLGGLITAGPGWPWVFFINVPVGVVVCALLARFLPALRAGETPEGRVDAVGAVLVAAASGSGIFALIRAGDGGWATVTTLVGLLVAVVLAVLFSFWERGTRTPLMDPGLLLRRPVAAGTAMLLVATALTVAVFFLGSFYLQDHEGHGALATGLLFLPVALTTMAGASTAGKAFGSLGGRVLTPAGTGIAAVGFAVPVLWTSTAGVAIGLSVAGAGLGVMFVVSSATALGTVTPHEAGVASGLLSTFHEFGAAGGAAIVSSVAAASLTAQTVTGFRDAFLVCAIGAGAGAVLLTGLAPTSGTAKA
jgi:EmrB/QacA subfamily drug resistance transporter